MDTMFINECRMLTAIDRSIQFRSVVLIDTKTQDDYYKALIVIFANTTRADLPLRQYTVTENTAQ